MKCADARRGIALAIETGLLEQISPAFADEDRAELARARTERVAADADKISRLAACMSALHERPDFAAERAREAMETMKLSNEVMNRTAHLITCTDAPPILDDLDARRFLARLGVEHAEDFIPVRATISPRGAEEAALLRGVISRGEPTHIRDLAVSGNDLKEFGMKPGPLMGETPRRMLEVVIADPSRNQREELLSLIA